MPLSNLSALLNTDITILLIDDEQTLLDVTKTYLEKMNPIFKITAQNDPKKALNLAQIQDFDIIVCDYQMPELNGLELLERLREINIDTTFIMFTGRSREEVAIKALNLGADYYIQKGGDVKSQFSELINLIEKSVKERRLKEAFRESETQFETLFNQISDAAFVYYLGTKEQPFEPFIAVNDEACKRYGYAREVFLKKTVEDIIPKERIGKAQKNVKLLVKKKNLLFENIHVYKNGKTVPVEINSSIISFNGRKTVLAIVRDISERKKMEYQLIQTKEKFRVLFEEAPMSYQLLDNKGKIVDVNTTWLEILGYKQRRIIGKHFTRFLKKDSRQRFTNFLNGLSSNGTIGKIELEILTANKKTLTISISAKSKYDENDNLTEIHCIFQDISKMKQIEKEIIEERDKLQQYLDLSPNLLVIIDHNEKIIEINKRGCELLGYPYEEIIGKNWFDNFIKKSVVDEIRAKFSEIIDGNLEHHRIIEGDVIASKGEIRTILWHNSYLKNSKDKIYATISSGVDITERNKILNQLRLNEHKYKRLFNNPMVGLYRTRIFDSKIVDINQRYAELAGYDSIEQCKKEFVPLNSYIYPEQREELVKILQEKGSIDNYEIDIRRIDGNEIKLLISAQIFPDQGFIEGAIIDITELAEKQNELKATYQKYQQLFETSIDGIVYTDIDGKILNANKAFLEIIGYTLDEAKELDYLKLTPKKWYEMEEEIIKNQVFVRGFSDEFEKEYIRKDGSVVPIRIKCWLEYDQKGNPTNVWAVVKDISKEKEIAIQEERRIQLIRKREKEITALLEGAHAVLEMKSFDETARTIFDIASNIIGSKTGYVALASDDGTENDLLFLEDGGFPCTVDENLPMPIRGLRAEAYEKGEAVYENDFMKTEWIKYLPEGHLELPNILFAPLVIKEKAVGVIGLSMKDGDFTEEDARLATLFGEYASFALLNSRNLEELQKRETRLEEKQELLIRQKEDLENFSSTVAHDIKGKLTVLQLLVDELENNSKTKAINEQIIDITEFLNNLLYLTRNTDLPDKELIDLNQLITKVVARNKKRLQEINVTVKSMPKIYGNQLLIQQVFENLLMNVINHSKATEVVFDSKIRDDDIEISIVDNGIGITKEKMLEIKNSIITKSFASLGLQIVMKIIKDHNGDFDIQGIPGKGTEVHLFFPKNNKHE